MDAVSVIIELNQVAYFADATGTFPFPSLSGCDNFELVVASKSLMPLRETEAIVLRTYRLGEADKIVSLFTRQMGRLRAVAAGARRTKSRYGSTLEPLSYVRIWVFERENRDLLRMNSAEIDRKSVV